MTKPADEFPQPTDPKDAAIVEMAKDLGVDVASLVSESILPFSGIAVKGFLGFIKNAYGQYAQAKINSSVAEYLELLRQRIEDLDDDTSRKATWEYVTGPENIIEIQRMVEVTLRTRETEKVESAMSNGIYTAMHQGTDDREVREFTAAFIRDCTGMEIRALKALDPFGTHQSNGEMADWVQEQINMAISKRVSTRSAVEQELLVAALTKLHSLGLCMGAATFGGSFNPHQRSGLGDEVVKRLELVVSTPNAGNDK